MPHHTDANILVYTGNGFAIIIQVSLQSFLFTLRELRNRINNF